jgi:peptide-methionine (S)-S-oxide reductase
VNIKTTMPNKQTALTGRAQQVDAGQNHFVNNRRLKGPYPDGFETTYFALGCYWGAERAFWQLEGVWVTAVGNIAGFTPNPTYQELCTGQTGHAEAVMVVFDPGKISYEKLLEVFWQSHNPTQGMRQGNDVGSQYRSGAYWTTTAQQQAAEASKASYQKALAKKGFGDITTEVIKAGTFYFAEEYHQQYLAKNPNGYCGLAGTGVELPET